ncbi:MAG: hypothetical protein RMK50_04100 [Nitrososphaerota archaeon]|nr:hypothetical protein [Candidatus Bathyarchaeota archaeon]MDW8193983.1 hypothetical protein [Nitrososphaerota archaeon]
MLKGLNVIFSIVRFMYFDITMPITLFAVVLTAVLLNGKIECKLKMTFEEKEIGIRDVVLFVAAIALIVSIMVLIPRMAVTAVFLFAYSILLFTFTYILSDVQTKTATVYCAAFAIITFSVATASIMAYGLNSIFAYGASALYILCGFSILALFYARRHAGKRWYLAVLPSALFLALYLFYGGTAIWDHYLLNVYGIIFAVMIILYLGNLFTWKSTLVFTALLTVADILLVLVTRTMVSAATHVSSLKLPVLITMPTIPQILTSEGVLYMSLGLGDFFFAGLIALQTLKKFGLNTALLSAAAMMFSFFIFEAMMINIAVAAFPGTVMIICGWLPILVYKTLARK